MGQPGISGSPNQNVVIKMVCIYSLVYFGLNSNMLMVNIDTI